MNSLKEKILAIDVHYKESYAKTVGVLFHWDSESPIDIKSVNISEVKEYIPGQFYKRELPCILKLLEQIDVKTLDIIIVDGHVYINNERELGLGGHLYESLRGTIPIIGVAKKSFYNTEEVTQPLYRGKSRNPLFISSIGISTAIAMKKVEQMKGKYRIPDILKILDTKTKEN
ncbi:endonuclease V [Elizabethkingia meningoseptica]|nr:endonuclease V [Elizabethkingia meningoseptica]